MSRKLLVIPLMIAFSGFLLAQTIDVTATDGYDPVNHTRPEVTDWIDCGEYLFTDYADKRPFNRKAGVAEQIVISEIGSPSYEGLHVGVSPLRSWTDGTPIAEAAGIMGGWYVREEGTGFQFTVPAGTNIRRLHLYLNNYYSNSVLTATTSDGALYNGDTLYSTYWPQGHGEDRHFMIDFQATSDNETLVVTWIMIDEFGLDPAWGATSVGAAELIVSPALDVDETSTVIPEQFRLSQNYPNPFNPTTIIHYDLPKATQVTIAIYDLKGRAVKTLVNEFKDVGNHFVTWDARDDEGNRMSGGVYLYTINAGNYQKTQKMVLLK